MPDQPSNKVKTDLLPLQKEVPPSDYNKLNRKRKSLVITQEYLWEDTIKVNKIIDETKCNLEYLGLLATGGEYVTRCKKRKVIMSNKCGGIFYTSIATQVVFNTNPRTGILTRATMPMNNSDHLSDKVKIDLELLRIKKTYTSMLDCKEETHSLFVSKE